jgi:glycosyltransferase involved in cell wall biosynthesis
MEPVLKPIFKRVLRDAAAVQANSSGLRDLATQTSRSAEIEIIYNGVDCEQFQPAVRSGPQQPIHLISVCRLIERKGVGDLIDALPLIKEALGGVKLTVVGEGDLEAELKEQAGRLGLTDEIDWLGFVEHDRLPELYQQADIFVLPSHYEGMSNSLLESMAAGLAVVVTDTGGTGELFRENGMIVAPGQPKSIADAVIKLGRDARGLFASAARSREIAETFSWTEVARQYVETYERVLEEDERD